MQWDEEIELRLELASLKEVAFPVLRDKVDKEEVFEVPRQQLLVDNKGRQCSLGFPEELEEDKANRPCKQVRHKAVETLRNFLLLQVTPAQPLSVVSISFCKTKKSEIVSVTITETTK